MKLLQKIVITVFMALSLPLVAKAEDAVHPFDCIGLASRNLRLPRRQKKQNQGYEDANGRAENQYSASPGIRSH